MRPTMKIIKNKTITIIQNSKGLPNYTQREYLKYIRSCLFDELSENEIAMLRSEKINIRDWIFEITQEITEEIF